MFTCVICEASDKGTKVRRAHRSAAYCDYCAAEMQRAQRGYCPRCRASVPLTEMTTGMCKAHNNARFAAYRARNADAVRERMRANRKPEVMTEKRRAQIRAARKRYQARHRVELNARRRAYRAKRPDLWQRYYWSNVDACRERRKRQRIERKLAILRSWQCS